MKNRVIPCLLCVAVATLGLAPWARAANDIKADTTSMAALTNNWFNADPGAGGTPIQPGTNDIGEFDATVSVNSLANMTLGGATLVLGGLQFDTNMAGPLVLAAGSTLAVGTSGINMSSAPTNVTINAAYRSGTSQTWNLATNTTLTLNGTVLLDESSSAANTDPLFGVSGTQALTINGSGTVNVPNAIIEPNYTGSGTGIGGAGVGVIINGGTFNGAGVLIQRSSSGIGTPSLIGPINVPTTEGLVVNGSNTVVTLGTLTIGGGFGNNPGTANLVNGSTTITGAVTLGSSAGNSSPARWGGFEVEGGTFSSTDTNSGFVISPSPGGVLEPMEVYFLGGVSSINRMLIGSPLDVGNTTNNAEIFINGGTLYLGSYGITLGNSSTNNHPYNGTIGYFISLLSGVLGAQASWSSPLSMILSSTTAAPFTIQTADSNGVPHNITLSGVISGTNANPLIVTGGGVLTLAGSNTFPGVLSINGGVVNAGIAETPGTNGPFGAQTNGTPAGTILFGGGTLQYSASNNYDYSYRFDNGAIGMQPINIDTAGQSVTFATSIAGAGTTLTLADSVGTGSLTLSGANTYDTGTFVTAGTLNVNNTSGSATGSGTVTVSGTGKLAGTGTIVGNVVVNSGGKTFPGVLTPGQTTTVSGTLTYNTGSSALFDLSPSAAGAGNDKIVISAGGTLNCGNALTVNVTGAGLDTNDYVLYNVSGGTISGAFNTVPVFTGTALAHTTFYSVQQIGSQVLLHYTEINPPVITNQTAVPSSVQANQPVTISATVVAGDNPISGVTVNLSSLGGPANQALTNTSGTSWSATVTVPTVAFPGNYALGITATDTHTNTTTVPVALAITGATGTSETWNGADYANLHNWSDPANWASGLAPGFGDNIFFAGFNGPVPVMDQSYSLASVTFSAGATNFTITNNGANGVLTLSAGATNNSSTVQTLNVPVALNAANVALNDAASAGLVAGGVVSGPSADGLTTSGNVTLGNSNTFAGTTLVNSGTLKLNNSGALQNSTLNNSGGGAVSFGTLTAATLGGLSGTKNLALENATPAPVALTIGGNNISQTFSGALTDTGNGASVTITGNGTQTFTGLNTYTGPTTNGATSTLILGGAGVLGNGSYAGNIANSGSLIFNGTANQTLSGIISGAGSITRSNAGTLTLSGLDTYTGLTTIGSGATITIGGAGQLGGGSYAPNITDNGTLTYNSSAAQTLSGIISGAGALTLTGSGKLTLSGANTYSGKTTVGTVGAALQINNSSALKSSLLSYSAGTITFGNGVTLVNLGGLSGSSNSANLALVDSGSPVTLNVVNNGAQTFAGVLSDGGLGGSLLTGGSGQTLSATNTFIGPITVLSGSLTISGAGLLGGGNFPAILSPQTGSTFIWASSAAQTLSGAFEGGGSVQLTGSGQLTSTATNALTGGFSISSNSTFTVGGAGVMAGAGGGGAYGGAIANSGTFNYNSSAASTLSGTITGTGGKINVNGTGQVTLTSTASTYSNTVSTVTAGVLAYSNDGLTNGASGPPGVVPSTITTNIILNGGDLMGTATFTLNSNRFIGVGPKTGNVGTNALIDSSGGTFTIAGSIISAGNTGSNGLIINSETNGGGTVILTASNNITGPITIDAGVLSIAAPGVLDNGLYAGNITNSGTFDYSGSQPQTLSGVISDGLAGSGTLSLGANGTNLVTLTLTGANTFSGSITIPTGDVLNINGGGLLGAVTGTTGSYAGGVSVSGVINFNSSGSQTVTAGISGPGALSHNGTGKLTLAGSMDYLGPTTNDNGTLALVGDGFSTGFLLETSNITVNAPGIIDPTGLTSDGSLHVGDPNVSQNQQTLSGNGTILSNVIVGTSGTLIPGPAGGFGTLTIGNSLTLNGGGSAVIIGVDHPITGVINDSVTAKSIAVSAGSTLTVSQGANDLQTGDTFHLFNITGNSGISSLHNFALTLPATGPVSGVTYVWNTNNLATTGTLILTTGAAAVPPVSVVPTNLVFALSSGSLQISWPSDHTGWTLQSNSINLAVPADWFNVAGSTTTNKVSIPLGTNGNVFYRLHLNY